MQEIRQVIEHLFKTYKLDSRQIAEKTGLSMRFIDDLLLISSLPPEICQAFDAEQMEKGKALALTKLPDAETQLRVFYQIDGRRMTTDMVTQIVADVLTNLQAPTPPGPPPETPPPPKLACSTCRREFLADELKPVFLCPDCESILRMTLRDLERQAAEREAASKSAPAP